MKDLISKELLSAVLDLKNRKTESLDINILSSEVIYSSYSKDEKDYIPSKSINIHELAHKCKEWALKDYEIHSAIIDNNKASCEIFSTRLQEKEFQAETEPEAIFKACQWIYDNQKEGN